MIIFEMKLPTPLNTVAELVKIKMLDLQLTGTSEKDSEPLCRNSNRQRSEQSYCKTNPQGPYCTDQDFRIYTEANQDFILVQDMMITNMNNIFKLKFQSLSFIYLLNRVNTSSGVVKAIKQTIHCKIQQEYAILHTGTLYHSK